jgi:hypothetical protein
MARNFMGDGGSGVTRSGNAYREDETDPYYLTLDALIEAHPIIFSEEPSLSYVSMYYFKNVKKSLS